MLKLTVGDLVYYSSKSSDYFDECDPTGKRTYRFVMIKSGEPLVFLGSYLKSYRNYHFYSMSYHFYSMRTCVCFVTLSLELISITP